MSVDLATVKRVAHLARIKVGDDEVAKLADELNSILGFVEQLGELDVTDVAPMTSVTPMQMRMRDDV
ncbi:Asp-tRNA(Asn)/Glu-tRNA(Gln) amidotransferase subunit GatC, partial [Mycobacterium tuberculosis]|nr:Asp-tRNA(Asn)/Glu-tRNA(Gln) amidotransferase subunit GatC [Mycobacterium tuberculosis]